MIDYKNLENIARKLRRSCVEISHQKHASHLGSALSMIDILAYLYYVKMNHEEDEFILSKGHAVIGLYAILLDKGFITQEMYDSYRDDGSYLIDHPNHKVPGISLSTGALGHGLAVSAGKAWGKRMKGEKGITYCMIGDGEAQEGSIWETILFTSRNNLFKNLVLIVDLNGYQGFSDPSDKLVSHDVLINMLKATGLDVRVINGHNFYEIEDAFSGSLTSPRIIIANTIKGKGVSFMEKRFEWHYKSPDAAQVARALKELE